MSGLDITREAAFENYVKAHDKGLLKIMSKMGISTVASYTGAQIFEAIGLGADVMDRFFGGAPSRLGGVGLDHLAAEVARLRDCSFTASVYSRKMSKRPVRVACCNLKTVSGLKR